ncbi:trypsin-like peptidase domain-containing protein [Propioniciclava soli]|uniref:Trypsin-like peptidase domain-containing protein n=1 Tax=Propioniciclava soli TaxID=2775081 RepID=A0ABZ3C9H5_9ACTN
MSTQTPHPTQHPYPQQDQYPRQDQYPQQGQYPEQGQYPQQGQYAGPTAFQAPIPSPAPAPTGSGASRGGWARPAAIGLAAGALSSLLTIGGMQTLAPVATTAPTAAAPAAVSGSASTTGWAAVASAVAPSVVSIGVTTAQGAGAGSGVVWDAAGHVVTNAHVVAGAGTGATITVTLSDGHRYDADVVGTDPTTDLAVLQLRNAPDGLTPIDHSATQVGVGDAVMAIGNPLGLAGTVTTGIVSAIDRPVATSASEVGSSQPVVTNAIQTSAAINPGNSGGALVNDAGTLVGINSSIASLTQGSGQAGNIGIGFAIPTAEVDLIVPQLISTGTAQHAYLGVGSRDAVATTDGASVTGAGIEQVVGNGPAASVLQPGDIVTAIDGAPVTGTWSLIGHVRALPVGQQVMVSFVRGSQPMSGQVTLGQNPNS